MQELQRELQSRPRPNTEEAQQDARLTLYLQAFRYMIAMYAPDQAAVRPPDAPVVGCSSEIVTYLKTAMKNTNDIYNWPKSDRQYYRQMSFRPVDFEDPSLLFKKMKASLEQTPYAVRSDIIR